MGYGEVTLSLDIALLIALWWPRYMDYILLQLCLTRAIAIWLLFNWITENAPGFQSIDLKVLHDAFYIWILPATLLLGINWRLVLLSTVFTVIGNLFTIQAAYQTADGNMSCFDDP